MYTIRGIDSNLAKLTIRRSGDCIGGTGAKCTTVTAFDVEGKPIKTTSARGIDARTWYDLAGKPVRTVVNYVDGAYSGSATDKDIVTTTSYSLTGQAVTVTDTLGNVTSTSYDVFDRPMVVTKPDRSWTKTYYTPAGRVDRVSRPAAPGQTETAVAWTKNVYDLAGRQTQTMANYDATNAGMRLATFEDGLDGFTLTRDGFFLSSGGMPARVAGTAATGTMKLAVRTTAAGQGVASDYSGTFVGGAGQTYAVHGMVRGPIGSIVEVLFGQAASGGYAATTVTLNGGWQAFDISWAPATSYSSSVRVAVRSKSSATMTFSLDDIVTYEATAGTTLQKNIPASLTVFDKDGHVTASVLPPGTPGTDSPEVTSTRYDALGRATDVIVNCVACTGQSYSQSDSTTNLTTTNTYDALGRVTDAKDPNGHITHATLDNLGRVLSTTLNYDGSTSSLTDVDVTAMAVYDNLGEVLATCTPEAVRANAGTCTATSANAWRYSYDAAGHVIAATPPANAAGRALVTTSTLYDTSYGADRVTSTCEYLTVGSCLRTTQLLYDDLGRVTNTTVLVDATVADAAGTTTTQTTYDGLGRQKTVTSSADATGFSIAYADATDQVTVSRGSSIVTDTIGNPDGTVAQRTDNAGAPLTFGYDLLGRLTDVGPTASPLEHYTWRLDGLVSSRAYGGLSIAYGYDAAKRPISATVTRQTVTHDVFTRSYDRAGNATSDCIAYGASNCSGGWRQSYTYDALNRVVGSTVSGASSQPADSKAYSYDADSRRLTVVLDPSGARTTTTSEYDATGSIKTEQAAATTTYTYDPLGNLASSYPGTPAASTSYAYDPAGRLTRIVAGATTVSFGLDALGRHMFQTVVAATSNVESDYRYLGTTNAVTRILSYDNAGGHVLTGTTNALIDALGARCATTNAAGVLVNLLLPDLHGNTAALYDGAANLAMHYAYDPYGVEIGHATGSASVPWRYQGRLLESAPGQSDLYDFAARSYDPGLGAFTSLDTVAGGVQNPISLNRYLYGNANPATMIDPSGHAGLKPLVENDPWTPGSGSSPDTGASDPTGSSSPGDSSTAATTTSSATQTGATTGCYGNGYCPGEGYAPIWQCYDHGSYCPGKGFIPAIVVRDGFETWAGDGSLVDESDWQTAASRCVDSHNSLGPECDAYRNTRDTKNHMKWSFGICVGGIYAAVLVAYGRQLCLAVSSSGQFGLLASEFTGTGFPGAGGAISLAVSDTGNLYDWMGPFPQAGITVGSGSGSAAKGPGYCGQAVTVVSEGIGPGWPPLGYNVGISKTSALWLAGGPPPQC